MCKKTETLKVVMERIAKAEVSNLQWFLLVRLTSYIQVSRLRFEDTFEDMLS